MFLYTESLAGCIHGNKEGVHYTQDDGASLDRRS